MIRTSQLVSLLSATSIPTSFVTSLVCEIWSVCLELSQLADETIPTISSPSTFAIAAAGRTSIFFATQEVAKVENIDKSEQ